MYRPARTLYVLLEATHTMDINEVKSGSYCHVTHILLSMACCSRWVLFTSRFGCLRIWTCLRLWGGYFIQLFLHCWVAISVVMVCNWVRDVEDSLRL
jgi:hypothetical protein